MGKLIWSSFQYHWHISQLFRWNLQTTRTWWWECLLCVYVCWEPSGVTLIATKEYSFLIRFYASQKQCKNNTDQSPEKLVDSFLRQDSIRNRNRFVGSHSFLMFSSKSRVKWITDSRNKTTTKYALFNSIHPPRSGTRTATQFTDIY